GPRERPDGDAVADATTPPGRRLELGFERGPELMARHRFADRVEVPQPVERARQRLPRPIFGVGQTLERMAPDPAFELIGAPLGPIPPAARRGRVAEFVAEVGDEGAERRGGRGPAFVVGERAETAMP